MAEDTKTDNYPSQFAMEAAVQFEFMVACGGYATVAYGREIQKAIDKAIAIERTNFAGVLSDHWLTHIQCNHENKTDKAFCSCSEMGGEECPSVGAAVQTWIDHVLEQIPA